MRRLLFCVIIYAASLHWGTPAAAGHLCDDADKDSFADDVCWLLEYVSRGGSAGSFHLVEIDDDECTVRVEFVPSALLVSLTEKDLPDSKPEIFIDFMRTDGTIEIKDKENGGLFSGAHTCWTLFGEDILYGVEDDDFPAEDQAKVCGPSIDHDRIFDTVVDLYSNHCPAVK